MPADRLMGRVEGKKRTLLVISPFAPLKKVLSCIRDACIRKALKYAYTKLIGP